MLLEEEMRRVIAYGEWQAKWWEGRATMRTPDDAAVGEGLRAYAAEHAAHERAFAAMLKGKWGAARLRVQTVLADLARPGFPESTVGAAVVVDLDLEVSGDVDGGGAEPERNENEEDEYHF